MNTRNISLCNETCLNITMDVLTQELETLEKFSFPHIAQHDMKIHEKDLKAFKRVISFYSDGWP
jgi:hypothetical protein